GQSKLRRKSVEAPAPAARDVGTPDEVHQAQRELLDLDARELQLLQSEAQVRRVLDIERELRTGKQDQPAEIRPQQGGDDERESRINDGQPRGVHDERREAAAHGSPSHARYERTDERGPPTHACVRDEKIERSEERAHYYVRGELHARGSEHVEKRQLPEHADRSA